MPRPKTISDVDVLAAAREVFLNRGPNVSTVEIAKRVGLSQPALFQRFGDKASLFLKAMTPRPLDVDAIIGPNTKVERSDPAKHLEELAIRLFDAIINVVSALQIIDQNRALESRDVIAAHEAPDSRPSPTTQTY